MRKTIGAALGAALLLVFTVGTAGTASPPREESGQKFHFVGNATDALDPENQDNEVARFDTTSGAPVAMIRNVDELVRELDNQLGFKYFMQNRNCGAGSPRIDLGLDTNDDGRADAFLEGHVQPDFLCVPNKWIYQDLTDDLPRWGSRGLTGGPGNVYAPWEVVEAGFGSVNVVYGQLIEDSQSFKLDNRGIAFYDLVSLGNVTFEDHTDSDGSNR
jgi:hypothetical protein